MRGDKQKHVAISHLSDNCPPKLAPLERLPKRHRVGPSASLDEYRNQLIVARVYHMQVDMSILLKGGDTYSAANLIHQRFIGCAAITVGYWRLR